MRDLSRLRPSRRCSPQFSEHRRSHRGGDTPQLHNRLSLMFTGQGGPIELRECRISQCGLIPIAMLSYEELVQANSELVSRVGELQRLVEQQQSQTVDFRIIPWPSFQVFPWRRWVEKEQSRIRPVAVRAEPCLGLL